VNYQDGRVPFEHVSTEEWLRCPCVHTCCCSSCSDPAMHFEHRFLEGRDQLLALQVALLRGDVAQLPPHPPFVVGLIRHASLSSNTLSLSALTMLQVFLQKLLSYLLLEGHEDWSQRDAYDNTEEGDADYHRPFDQDARQSFMEWLDFEYSRRVTP